MIQKLKIRFINYALRHLFPVVEIEQVLTSNKQGQLFLNGVSIDHQKLADLQSEVMLFRNTKIWGIMSNTLRHQAQLIIFKEAKDLQDVMNGKMILYTLDVQQKIVDLIDKAK